jgi:FeS assembly SUF system regulator
MLKISKIADYAVVVMVYMAKHYNLSYNARDIAEGTRIALPTVSKILKMMVRKGLLLSQRGAKGGYSLVREANTISMVEILEAVDGSFGMTDCTFKKGVCALEPVCSITSNWHVISQAIYDALSGLTLADMAMPLLKKKMMLKQPIKI